MLNKIDSESSACRFASPRSRFLIWPEAYSSLLQLRQFAGDLLVENLPHRQGDDRLTALAEEGVDFGAADLFLLLDLERQPGQRGNS